MSHTIHDEIGLESLDPNTTKSVDAQHFRRIIKAKARLAEAEAGLRDEVDAARAAGDSWTVIGTALGVTKQAAQQRFGH